MNDKRVVALTVGMIRYLRRLDDTQLEEALAGILADPIQKNYTYDGDRSLPYVGG